MFLEENLISSLSKSNFLSKSEISVQVNWCPKSNFPVILLSFLVIGSVDEAASSDLI